MRILSNRETDVFMGHKPRRPLSNCRRRGCPLSLWQTVVLLIVALGMVAVALLGNALIGLGAAP